MTDPTKEELKRAEEIWQSDAITRNPERYMFDCNQSHTEHAIGLIAIGLAVNREHFKVGLGLAVKALDAQTEKTVEAETERDRLRQVIIEIDSLEMQARSGDAGALLEAEAQKAKEAQGSGIVFSETAQESEIRAIIDSEGNARLYPNRKPDGET